MPKVFQSGKSLDKCFYAYTVKQCSSRIKAPWDLLLKGLSMLPRQWYSQTYNIIEPYIVENNIPGAYERLKEVYETIEYFEDYGLSFTYHIANISAAFQGLSFEEKTRFKTQSLFEQYIIRRIEECGRILLIHQMERSAVTSMGRRLLNQRHRNQAQLRNRTLAKNALYGTLSTISDAQKKRRAAETPHRAQALTDYYVEDCGYRALGVVITPGPEHSPGYGQILNPDWIAAGKPTPKDTHELMMKNWSILRASCAQDHVPLTGFRTVEPFRSGTPHYNFLFFFRCEHDEKIFLCHLHRIFPEIKFGGLKKVQDQRVRIIKSDGSPHKWSHYIQKSLPRLITDGSDQKVNESHKKLKSDSIGSSWCRIWNIRQYDFFGQKNIKYWRLLKYIRNPSKLLRSANVSDAIKDLFIAARGETIVINNEPVHTPCNYRHFLRLTECTMRSGNKKPESPRVLIQRNDVPDQGSVISILDRDNHGIEIIIPRKKLSHFDEQELRFQKYTNLTLQLCIRLPTTPIDYKYFSSLFKRRETGPPQKHTFGVRKY